MNNIPWCAGSSSASISLYTVYCWHGCLNHFWLWWKITSCVMELVAVDTAAHRILIPIELNMLNCSSVYYLLCLSSLLLQSHQVMFALHSCAVQDIQMRQNSSKSEKIQQLLFYFKESKRHNMGSRKYHLVLCFLLQSNKNSSGTNATFEKVSLFNFVVRYCSGWSFSAAHGRIIINVLVYAKQHVKYWRQGEKEQLPAGLALLFFVQVVAEVTKVGDELHISLRAERLSC